MISHTKHCCSNKIAAGAPSLESACWFAITPVLRQSRFHSVLTAWDSAKVFDVTSTSVKGAVAATEAIMWLHPVATCQTVIVEADYGVDTDGKAGRHQRAILGEDQSGGTLHLHCCWLYLPRKCSWSFKSSFMKPLSRLPNFNRMFGAQNRHLVGSSLMWGFNLATAQSEECSDIHHVLQRL